MAAVAPSYKLGLYVAELFGGFDNFSCFLAEQYQWIFWAGVTVTRPRKYGQIAPARWGRRGFDVPVELSEVWKHAHNVWWWSKGRHGDLLWYIVKHLLHVWLTVMSLWTQSSSQSQYFSCHKSFIPSWPQACNYIFTGGMGGACHDGDVTLWIVTTASRVTRTGR